MLYRRRCGSAVTAATLAVSVLFGCKASSPHEAERRAIAEVPVTNTWDFPAIEHPAHVLYTEGGIPHVYAANDHDAWMVTGFMHARDRYVQMELTRRFGQGRISELVGEAALTADQETRGRGGNDITDRLLAQLTPAEGALLDAYVEGINVYVRTLKNDPFNAALGIPTELPLVGIALGANEWTDVMQEMTRRDAVAMVTAVLFNSSFTSDDLDRQRVADTIPNLFQGAPNAALREAGLREDIFDWVTPVHPITSAAGFGVETAAFERRLHERTPNDRVRTRMPRDVVERAIASAAHFDNLRRGPPGSDYGSNAWALSSHGTPNGSAILSGDGHLPLSVPALLYQMGVDTLTFGGSSGQQLLGMWFPGVPMMALGTNGHVAFSFTYLYGDLVDWYAEELTLDASGAPTTSRFQGQDRALVSVQDTYVIADVPSLGSVGREETWTRWKTFDGRYITSIEGDLAPAGTVAGPGQTIVSMLGVHIIPRDVNMDGKISAVSFDYTGVDVSNLFGALRRMNRAANVSQFQAAQHELVGFAQNFAAADTEGSVYYSGYTATPCRTHLPRVGAGSQTRFADGADPRLLLDGTQYGAFTVEVGADNRAVESHNATDPSRCVVPFDRWPQALNPASGFTLTANNDIGNVSTDGSLANDEYYLGGPWAPGYRARTIHDTLAANVASRNGSVDAMAALQGNHVSHLSQEFLPYLTTAISEATALTAPATPEEMRVRALYTTHQAAIDEAMTRVSAWLTRGANAASGVDTFYDAPTASDRDDAVATMIFNAFFRKLNVNVFDDEGIDAVLALDPRFMRVASLLRFLGGRGPGNTAGLSSFDPTTNESAFFDNVSTGVVESSREILVKSLADALDELASPTVSPGNGGFGTSTQSAWLWGLRHQVAFESLITAYAGNVMGIDLIALATRISTRQLPLAPTLSPGDPREGIVWFPRPGDWLAVDAANPPLSGTDYVYRSGPVMRMVIELNRSGFVRGQNVIPAGQSGIAARMGATDPTPGATFKDQAALWLGNQTYPMRWTVDDVTSHAIAHDAFE